MIETVVKELGGLDIVRIITLLAKQSSVQIRPPGGCKRRWLCRKLEATAEDWDRVFSVNVKGTFFCCKHAGL